MSEPPFKVGDRVRIRPQSGQSGRMKVREGFVVRTHNCGEGWDGRDWWRVYVRREGVSRQTWYWDERIELIPLCDWTQDETAKALARAVLDNDLTAARALNDRLTELFLDGAK